MQIAFFIIVMVVLFKMIADYEPYYKKVQRMDNNPNNSVKSDKWLKEHPEWKGK